MCIAAAIVGGAVVGAGGSAIAGHEQAKGQRQAADTQQGMFNTITGQEQPFLNAGYGANTTLSQLLGFAPGTGEGGTASGTGLPAGYLTSTFNPSDLENYPGYQFALQQGNKALNSANSASVGALSGPALKSLMSFNQGLATQTYQNAFQNYQTQQNNIFNRLSGILSIGQNAAGNLGNTGAQLGTGIAQAQAAAAGSQAGAISGAAGNIGNSLSTLGLLKYMNGGSGGGGYGGGYG